MPHARTGQIWDKVLRRWIEAPKPSKPKPEAAKPVKRGKSA